MNVKTLVLLTVVVISLIDISVSQSPCVTPNGENGNCILLQNCEPFIKVWPNRTSKNIAFFRKSHCGFQADKPLVCCGTVAEMIEISVSTTTTTTTTTESTPPTPIPVSITTPQLFTSVLATNTPPSTRSISTNIRSAQGASGYESHPNFNLLPRPGVCGLQTTGEKITNGNVTDLDEYPWLAMLMYRINGKIVPNCGGSLINERYVLTAAHCIKGNLFSVRLGEYNIDTELDCIIQEGDEVCNDPYQEYRIEDYTIYTRYTNRDVNRYNDIALIRLTQNANITFFVRPICLPLNNERSNFGELLTVAGWGLTENNITSSVKLAVDIPVWSDISCREIYTIGYGVNISSRQFCAGGQGGKDSCGGDSGGPLMTTFPNSTYFYMEGIVSFGPEPCGRQATPGVYIRVTEYVQWVLDTMTSF